VQLRRRSISSESEPVYYLPYLSLYLYRETLICSVIFRHCFRIHTPRRTAPVKDVPSVPSLNRYRYACVRARLGGCKGRILFPKDDHLPAKKLPPPRDRGPAQCCSELEEQRRNFPCLPPFSLPSPQKPPTIGPGAF
jgi:hypothetical protein